MRLFFILNLGFSSVCLFVLCQQAEEVQLLRDALRSLRNNFRDHDPQHHTLDTLEQGIVSLIDRLHVLHTQRVQIPCIHRTPDKLDL